MKFMTATAVALALSATAAMAQDTSVDTEEMQASEDGGANATHDGLIRTRDITDGTIYTMNASDHQSWDPTTRHDEVGSSWESIGEIEDLVLSPDGKLVGLVAEVGGFLDVGDKHVMIQVDDVNLVAVDDTEYGYVTRLTEEELESMEDVDEGFWN
ncbi:PRC-barrel domain-containing protein [Amaricoccus macauensis]|uniref:PRC-barrel domain-containing protein n=1 Tax=Amaricoccus macauensis TaxID=57001 RepID=UPI003C7DA708